MKTGKGKWRIYMDLKKARGDDLNAQHLQYHNKDN